MRFPLQLLLLAFVAVPAVAQDLGPWPQHSMDRPVPPVVTPAPAATAAAPPSDAVVLFNGQKVANGYMEVVQGSGGIHTTRAFGDCQLHVEWATPTPATGEGQERGNSGVFLMSRYEIQVLDSYQSRTYADGQAAAVYGQYPPLANASRPPGEWQTYDIVFHAPRFDTAGKVLSPARVTVFHNGVLVQDNVALSGPTAHMRRPPYRAHPDKLPLMLQDHGNPVRYREIWIRELPQ